MSFKKGFISDITSTLWFSPQVLNSRKEGKWPVYRDGKAVIIEKSDVMVFFKNTYIAMHTMTLQFFARKLLDVQGYTWESLCCPQPLILGRIRGSREVFFLQKMAQ